MSLKLSKLFGMDIYTDNAEYRGKVYDIIINLEKGNLETITTEPLKVKTKIDAKKILSEKSIPYKNVNAAKDILIISKTGASQPTETKESKASARTRYRYRK